METFTVSELLKLRGVDLSKKIKLVRHKVDGNDKKSGKYIHIDTICKNGWLNIYQSVQGDKIFDNCDYLLVFIGDEGTKAKFVGMYTVKGKGEKNKDKFLSKLDDNTKKFVEDYPSFANYGDCFIYDLEKIDILKEFENRVIIEWGKSTLSWHQWQDKEIIEILPKGYLTKEFTGFLDFYLDYDELKEIIEHKDANKIWHTMLSSVYGVYLILDTKTGQQYIGSAYGENGGILGRWKYYVSTGGHGDNLEFKLLLENDNDYAKNFRFSILQTLPKTIMPDEVVAKENLYKKKFGSRVHGLNRPESRRAEEGITIEEVEEMMRD